MRLSRRCPLCGAATLDDLGHLIRCATCLAEMDRQLRPVAPMRSSPSAPPLLGDETMPTMVQHERDPTWIDLGDEIPTDPRQRPPAPVFARPPEGPPQPFAPPPLEESLRREARKKPWSQAVGDGGPPPGLDLLVAGLVGLDLLSMALWWRNDAPVANAMLLPLLGSILVAYFFWQGRNWARFLLLLGSLAEIVVIGLAFAFVRRHLTGPELVAGAVRLALDLYICWFCVRPDSVAFFEKRSGRR